MLNRPEIVAVYKPVGTTPLMALRQYQATRPELAEAKLTYVGRLDPMASGVLPLIIHPTKEIIAQTKGYDKKYQFSLILGVTTDTYDVLGLVQSVADKVNELSVDQIEDQLQPYRGTWAQAYPPFSSVRIGGRALFEYARSGQLNQVQIPKHSITIKELVCTQVTQIDSQEFVTKALADINSVQGDFRQKQIAASWTSAKLAATLPQWHLTVSCSSGTYIRGLAHSIGQDLGVGAICVCLVRTAVGPYRISDATVGAGSSYQLAANSTQLVSCLS